MKKNLILLVLVALVMLVTPAFADSNPFADVPAGHWSYDAVAFLASRGVVSGYPDGQYKGGQLATRYELASVVARALAKIDMEKASKEDLELVKKLVAEFKPELDALGVKIADIDKRVADLEKNIGGLRLNGFVWFDAKWRGSDNQKSTAPSFAFQRARFFVNYQADKNTSFLARVNFANVENKGNYFKIDRLFFTTKLPWDIKATIGYQTQDWDKEYHLYDQHVGGFGDRESYWTKRKFMGFTFVKDWGKFDLQAMIGRNHLGVDGYDDRGWEHQAYMSYAAKLGYKGEKLKLGLFYSGEKLDGDGDKKIFDNRRKGAEQWTVYARDLGNIQNYGAYLRYVLPFGEIFGTYNQQRAKACGTQGGEKIAGDARFWFAGFEIWNNYLAGFSFRAEYCRRDEGFIYNDGVYEQFSPMDDIIYNFGAYGYTRYGHDVITLATDYHFSKKFDMYVRYTRASALNSCGPDTAQQWDFGGRYRYSKNVAFMAQVALSDYGDGTKDSSKCARDLNYKGKEVIFRFRTQLTF